MNGRRRRTNVIEKCLTEEIGIYRTDTAFDRSRVTQFHCAKGNIYEMAAHISQRTCTKIPISTPPERHISFMIWTFWSSTKPEIPIYFLGNWLGFIFIFWRFNTLRPYGSVCPDFNFVNVSDNTRLNDGLRLPGTIAA